MSITRIGVGTIIGLILFAIFVFLLRITGDPMIFGICCVVVSVIVYAIYGVYTLLRLDRKK